ncbi:MAG TPA: FAD/NAD(P)-binding oxidoreductase [Nitrososphaeraceae archaeon]|nr:FAD/NAD(P)-binding oxidoreductase [Nitrososphaeraceae archaeon]
MSEVKRILILGAGFGGLTAANFLQKNLSSLSESVEYQISIIDQKDYFMMGLVNLWILSGIRTLEDSKIDLNRLEKRGIRYLNNKITRIDLASKTVNITGSSTPKIKYDYLIIALGTEYAVEEVNGFLENEGFNLYDPEQVPKLRERILSLKKGRIAICIASIPYKCPPAPYEASLLINDILVKNGTRDSIDIDIYTPTPISLPVAGVKVSKDVINLLSNNHVNFHPLHKIRTVLDMEKIEFENGSSVDYDLLILIPPHKVPEIVRNSGLFSQGENWINVDKFSLKTDYENVFAIGDVTEIKVNENVAIPKAGVFAEAQAKVVGQQIVDDIVNDKNKQSSPRFDGKGFCFMEVGNDKAGYVAVDLYHEHGPATLLEPPSEESYKKKLDFERSKLNEWFLS